VLEKVKNWLITFLGCQTGYQYYAALLQLKCPQITPRTSTRGIVRDAA